MTWHRTLKTPLGLMGASASERGITCLRFLDAPPADLPGGEGDTHLDRLEQQLAAYFEGGLRCFDVALAVAGSPFQQRVWALLQSIPFGEVRRYGELARALEQPGAARAVGLANRQNPIAIVVPCHRVIGANGSLTGYAGGLDRKRRLLALEGFGSGQLF